MHFHISTATSLALSHEVNPGVQEHQFCLSKENPGPTSAACVFLAAAAAEQAALWPGCVKGVALSEADGEGVAAEEVEVASPPCVNCWSLGMRAACDCASSLCDCASGVFGWALGLKRGRRHLPRAGDRAGRTAGKFSEENTKTNLCPVRRTDTPPGPSRAPAGGKTELKTSCVKITKAQYPMEPKLEPIDVQVGDTR